MIRKGSPSYRRRRRLYFEMGRTSCCWCKKSLTFRQATIEHLLPRSRGGKNNIENLDIACGPCNGKRGAPEVYGPFPPKPQTVFVHDPKVPKPVKKRKPMSRKNKNVPGIRLRKPNANFPHLMAMQGGWTSPCSV